jgi:AcrR family transcriptional regulator
LEEARLQEGRPVEPRSAESWSEEARRRPLPVSAPAATDKPNGPRSAKGAETRGRLLAAAKAIFEENGFLDARISDIAERAGLSHGSFYHYFDSKDEVFREVAETVENQLSAPLGTVILDPTSDATPAERIGQAIRLHLESYRQEARIMGVIEQVSRYDPEVRAARYKRLRFYGEQVEESIRRLQRHGLVDSKLDPVIAAAALGSMTSRFPEMWLVEGSLDCSFDAGVEQLTRVFVNALGLIDDRDDEERPARRVRRAR